jgi:hypothetical protein
LGHPSSVRPLDRKKTIRVISEDSTAALASTNPLAIRKETGLPPPLPESSTKPLEFSKSQPIPVEEIGNTTSSSRRCSFARFSAGLEPTEEDPKHTRCHEIRNTSKAKKWPLLRPQSQRLEETPSKPPLEEAAREFQASGTTGQPDESGARSRQRFIQPAVVNAVEVGLKKSSSGKARGFFRIFGKKKVEKSTQEFSGESESFPRSPPFVS